MEPGGLWRWAMAYERRRLRHTLSEFAEACLERRVTITGHPELGDNDVETLGDVLANAMKRPKAAGVALVIDVDNGLDPGVDGNRCSDRTFRG